MYNSNSTIKSLLLSILSLIYIELKHIMILIKIVLLLEMIIIDNNLY